MDNSPQPTPSIYWPLALVGVLATGVAVLVFWLISGGATPRGPARAGLSFQPRRTFDIGGYQEVQAHVGPWRGESLEDCAKAWDRVGYRLIDRIDRDLASASVTDAMAIELLLKKAALFNYEGDPKRAYEVLAEARRKAEVEPGLAEESLYTIIFSQGVTALRLGENDNCVLCRGESSCIFPIAPAAVHTNPAGSRLAVKHFDEYLKQFPDDVEVEWLCHLARMTLGEASPQSTPRSLLSLDRFYHSEQDVGIFRDVGHRVGLSRLNLAGGAIMDDFDGDGLLDLVVTTIDPTQHLALYRNTGDGTFEDRTEKAGLLKQLGGMYCVQTDYDNDGHLDLFVLRGAWFRYPVRPSLLRNNGDGTFTDVTARAGLIAPMNAISAAWADYDNDGHLDLFVACQQGTNRLYRNKGDGTFEETTMRAGVLGTLRFGQGAAWIDHDNDGYPDLFITYLRGPAQLYRNNRDGTFTDVTKPMGVTGPEDSGFSCWAFDYDNDGWLDLFATCYYYPLREVVAGMGGERRKTLTCKLFRNRHGRGFDDVTADAGLDGVYGTMGSNFGDIDNDGFLDFYLATGGPDLDALIPNRLFKNVRGKRFTDITASSRTGHLQKGHAVAFGDWRRCGSQDLFMQVGGAIPGDRYHNVLFQSPGQGNNWLSVKLVGTKTNRAAIGARIKVVTAGDHPLTVHRHVSSGSSFGANPLEQHFGLGKADRVALVEVYWPTSRTTQVFRDVKANQGIVITEGDDALKARNWRPILIPPEK